MKLEQQIARYADWAERQPMAGGRGHRAQRRSGQWAFVGAATAFAAVIGIVAFVAFGAGDSTSVSPAELATTAPALPEQPNPTAASVTTALDAPIRPTVDGAAQVVLGDRLFVLGGYAGRATSASALTYDLRTQRWVVLPDLPRPAADMFAVAVGVGSLLEAVRSQAFSRGPTRPAAGQSYRVRPIRSIEC